MKKELFKIYFVPFNIFEKISESVEFWNQQANVELPEKQMDQRKNVNSTFKEIKMDTLQNLFLKSALEMPKKQQSWMNVENIHMKNYCGLHME